MRWTYPSTLMRFPVLSQLQSMRKKFPSMSRYLHFSCRLPQNLMLSMKASLLFWLKILLSTSTSLLKVKKILVLSWRPFFSSQPNSLWVVLLSHTKKSDKWSSKPLNQARVKSWTSHQKLKQNSSYIFIAVELSQAFSLTLLRFSHVALLAGSLSGEEKTKNSTNILKLFQAKWRTNSQLFSRNILINAVFCLMK